MWKYILLSKTKILFIVTLALLFLASFSGAFEESSDNKYFAIVVPFFLVYIFLNPALSFFFKQRMSTGKYSHIDYIENDPENHKKRKLWLIVHSCAFIILSTGYLANLFGYISKNPTIILSANSGHYEFRKLAKPTRKATVSAKIKIIAEEINKDWPAGAYFGFYDSKDRNSSVHFTIIKNKPGDQYAAGYRVIEHGREKVARAITEISKNDFVNVVMEINDGTIVININDEGSITVHTDLYEVIPSVSVSSGRAHFEIST